VNKLKIMKKNIDRNSNGVKLFNITNSRNT
jgi:hypothetical protein